MEAPSSLDHHRRHMQLSIPRVRKILVITHDVIVTALALLASLYLRFEEAGILVRKDALLIVLPFFLLWASIVYRYAGLYQSKWRFASVHDLYNIVKAIVLVAISLVVIDYVLTSSSVYWKPLLPNITLPGEFLFGKVTIVLYVCLQLLFLGGPRIAYRYFRYTRALHHAADPHSQFCVVVGRAADAELFLRAVESGAVKRIWPLGILSPSPADQHTVVRNVKVLGGPDDLDRVIGELRAQGNRISLLILTNTALDPELTPEVLMAQARRLGLDTRRLVGIEDAGINPAGIRVTRVNVEDLLLRPSVRIDYTGLENFVRGKSILVTGGGGSIGAEICLRAVGLGAAKIFVIENSEPALRAVLDRLEAMRSGSIVEGRIADVRDRDRIFQLFREFKPDVVFHAAALKHIQLVEKEWGEGVKTNVFGSINVADAAVENAASIMVMISTDKAIQPVSMLGATKRFAEMYCQALDSNLPAQSYDKGLVHLVRAGRTRLVSVRFGNVLASNGSVVPRFKAQIDAGGPVTITHPDMVRYFMTIQEACDLVLASASHAAGTQAGPSVYVLNMGQPVKIVDLAERMIRLAGFEPGREIEIAFTGIRPGERLNEILFAKDEPVIEIGIDGVVATTPPSPSLTAMRMWQNSLRAGLAAGERRAIFNVFREAMSDFQGTVALMPPP